MTPFGPVLHIWVSGRDFNARRSIVDNGDGKAAKRMEDYMRHQGIQWTRHIIVRNDDSVEVLKPGREGEAE